MIARNTLALVTASLAAGWAALILRAKPGGGKAKPKRPPQNTYDLPIGESLAKELKAQYDRVAQDFVAKLPKAGTELPSVLPKIASQAASVAQALAPHLTAYWDESGKKLTARLGLPAETWDVASPRVADAIRKQSLTFANSTLVTTRTELHRALDKLRDDVAAGRVSAADAHSELRTRLASVFNEMKTKAPAAATTEASRATHAAQVLAAEASGIVAGLELLVSGRACPLCRKVATEARRVRLGEAFAVIGRNKAYATIKHPPIHIHCLCSIAEILKPEAGGPRNVKWANTLQQPQKGLGEKYVPPPGMKVAKPQPKKLHPSAHRLRRIKTPSPKIKQWAQQGGFIDPKTNKWVSTTERLAADHLYPKDLIIALPGFDKLSQRQQEWLLNYPGNFVPLIKAWNSSKRSRLADEWAKTPMGKRALKEYIDALREHQQAFEGFAKSMIDLWLAR